MGDNLSNSSGCSNSGMCQASFEVDALRFDGCLEKAFACVGNWVESQGILTERRCFLVGAVQPMFGGRVALRKGFWGLGEGKELYDYFDLHLDLGPRGNSDCLFGIGRICYRKTGGVLRASEAFRQSLVLIWGDGFDCAMIDCYLPDIQNLKYPIPPDLIRSIVAAGVGVVIPYGGYDDRSVGVKISYPCEWEC